MGRRGTRRRPIDSGWHAGDPRHRLSAEQRLLSAVLELALWDLAKLDPERGGVGEDAFRWITSDYDGWTFGGWSFVALCSHLGLAPDYFRERLPAIALSKAKRRHRVIQKETRRAVGE